MIITTSPNDPRPMYASTPTYAVPPKLAKDTVYMPSHVTRRVLGAEAQCTHEPEQPPRRDG